MEKTYSPQVFEKRIYQMWLDDGNFKAVVNPDKKPFTIVLPPPNITGKLHEGHALNHTMQDILVRYKRMKGFEALWLPGTDHASIATEVKILDQVLREEGRTKDDMTRDEFLVKAWAWKDKYGGQIVEQMKRLGNSCDWDRERFTMDDVCSKAVLEVFIRLYQEGLIYKGNRLINWCPTCGTSLSDAEVEHNDVSGAFYDIAYPVVDSEEKLIISTTRPETMLADTAVAVHPEDDRYKHLIGKFVHLPLMDRQIPVVADDYVDRELGTGALKVTPAHDPNDYEIGQRHGLEVINIFTEDAKVNEEGGIYAGLDRYQARKQVVKDLSEQGYLVGQKDHVHAVGHCYRCHKVVEPRISDQWFVAMEDLAKQAKQSVEQGDMKFIPARYVKIYNNWLDNIRDWNISRQLWWGHRIPAYYCDSCNYLAVAHEMPDVCPDCGGEKFTQDPDVLDTWFSSALWPFSTLGWPDQSPDLDYFYPTDVLVTGYDIIFFWVVRMMFSGLKFMDEAPFHTTLINGIVRDSQGRKISKSLNNGTDPIEVIDEYGADALRYMLISGTATGNDTRFSMERVESARNFANKLWNASRFVLSSLEEAPAELTGEEDLTMADRWILSELNLAITDITDSLEKSELGMAADRALDFAWGSYCDWYIELSKKRLYAGDATVRTVLWTVLKDLLKLMHPFMPFITEEIWQSVPGADGNLVVASWPELRQVDQTDLDAMETIMGAIGRIRNLRAEMDLPVGRKGRLYLSGDPRMVQLMKDQTEAFQALASVSEVLDRPEMVENASTILVNQVELTLPLDDLIDYAKEYQRLSKEKDRLEGEIERAKAKLNNPGFVSKAPAQLVENERNKVSEYQEQIVELADKMSLIEDKK